jgi:hypothetical protein
MDYLPDLFAYWEDKMTTITIDASPARGEQAERLLREPALYFTEARRRAQEDVRAEMDRRQATWPDRFAASARPTA